PIYSNGIERELVTPTGAAIAVSLASGFGNPPPMTIGQVALGAGSAQLPIPNILRLWIGESRESGLGNGELVGDGDLPISHPSSPDLETVCVLETQIDDLSPQAIGYVYDVLFNVGALDVFTQPIGMKKSRPGILLTVICFPDKLTVCEDILFRETTTLGIRHFSQQRTILHREIQEVKTDYGVVRVKVASRASAGEKVIANIQPEYEDCAAIARAYNLSWREVHQLAMDAWYLQHR
ncbi:MAG TPA: TIGR00299 family protein, partial [Cyanobacteria bacterium UBA11166]|nr:TIGR00299 family protein [Cyanobacteria bacterium UBA11166]